jgi:UDP-glucose 4-epimerase
MIAIWGANGFIGRHCVDHLISSGMNDLKLFARNFDGFPFSAAKFLQFYTGDFKQQTHIQHILDCTHLVLMVSASDARTFISAPEKERTENLEPYQNFFSLLRQHPTRARHIVFLSSGGAVYGHSTDNTPAKETDPLQPISPYGEIKKAIEHELLEHCAHTHDTYTILRIANPVGVWHKNKGLVPSLLRAARTKTPLNVPNNGHTVRDFFAAQDLADAIMLACTKLIAHNTIFNVGSGKGMSVHDMIDLTQSIFKQKIFINYAPPIATDVDYNVLECTKIEEVLGWRASTPLSQVISEMWNKK